jgi:ankyrin repeat protein
VWVDHGFEPPDTPVMALHRGRIDLLESHLAQDPDLLTRTFDKSDIYPLAPACAREPFTGQGTPLGGTTLLHIAAYFDELEIAEWLLDRGMNPDARSAIDADGFGGYTALYSSVVSQRGFWVNYGKGQPDEARFTHLLLDRGANPNVRASLSAPRRGARWWAGARVPKRDTARLGRTVPRARLRESRGASVDRVERRCSMSLSEIFRHISDASDAGSGFFAPDRQTVNELWGAWVTPPRSGSCEFRHPARLRSPSASFV